MFRTAKRPVLPSLRNKGPCSGGLLCWECPARQDHAGSVLPLPLTVFLEEQLQTVPMDLTLPWVQLVSFECITLQSAEINITTISTTAPGPSESLATGNIPYLPERSCNLLRCWGQGGSRRRCLRNTCMEFFWHERIHWSARAGCRLSTSVYNVRAARWSNEASSFSTRLFYEKSHWQGKGTWTRWWLQRITASTHLYVEVSDDAWWNGERPFLTVACRL